MLQTLRTSLCIEGQVGMPVARHSSSFLGFELNDATHDICILPGLHCGHNSVCSDRLVCAGMLPVALQSGSRRLRLGNNLAGMVLAIASVSGRVGGARHGSHVA